MGKYNLLRINCYKFILKIMGIILTFYGTYGIININKYNYKKLKKSVLFLGEEAIIYSSKLLT